MEIGVDPSTFDAYTAYAVNGVQTYRSQPDSERIDNMNKLTMCECPECDTQFAMAKDVVDEMAEVTCPLCEGRFEHEDDDQNQEFGPQSSKLIPNNPRRR